MIKRKFGDALKAKTEVAIRNEVLAKLVCHNVVVCIHEMFALGINVKLGCERREEAKEENPRILKFPGA